MTNKWPTDLDILKQIYCQHERDYLEWKGGDSARITKNYVPIDIKRVADAFHVDEDIVFGRLYYYLDQRYSYKKSNGACVHFFCLRVGEDPSPDLNCVHFPYLVSVIASLRSDFWRAWVPTFIAGFALIVSALALGWTIRSDLHKEDAPAKQMQAVEQATRNKELARTPSLPLGTQRTGIKGEGGGEEMKAGTQSNSHISPPLPSPPPHEN